MARRREPPDDADEWEDAEDDEAPAERDLSDDEADTPTLPCPHCGKPVFEFVDRCPYCGDWITPSVAGRKNPWLVLLVFIVVAALLFWWLR